MERWERVKYIMQQEGMNKNSFSAAIGMSHNVTITRIINEQRKPSQATCEKIIEKFSNYDLNWLLDGIGEPYTNISSSPIDKREMLIAIIDRYAKGNKAAMARMLGVTPQTVSTWLSRNTFDMELIYAKCECINPHWLLSGKGEMKSKVYKADEEKIIELSDCPIQYKASTNNSENSIPLIPTSAIDEVLITDSKNVKLSLERYVVPIFNGADFLIYVKGEAMSPQYNSGDIIACKSVPISNFFFQWNKVYVIGTNQGAIINRIKPGSDKDHVLIVSDNEAYDPFELNVDSIHSIAIVIGVIKSE